MDDNQHSTEVGNMTTIIIPADDMSKIPVMFSDDPEVEEVWSFDFIARSAQGWQTDKGEEITEAQAYSLIERGIGYGCMIYTGSGLVIINVS